MVSDIRRKDRFFIKKVLHFYKQNGRNTLPWRNKITPYKIVVSEIMLQQTQVARVIPKFEQWIKTYPTLEALKHSSLQDILILWQGLGYQRRAKALYDISQQYTKIPKTFDELCDMPCIGSYTASAIGAFAYDTFLHPMLETNIRTALIEEFYMDMNHVDDKTLYDDIERLSKYPTVKKIGARVWYYALMDYGAYLKQSKISHNKKSKHYVKQSSYQGSYRQLRAKVLFAILHKETIPEDIRTQSVLEDLMYEGYILKKKSQYSIQDNRNS